MQARLVVLVSGTGTNLQALLDACADESYGARVVAVGADREGCTALDRARDRDIPTFTHRVKDFPDRAGWDATLAESCREHRPDLVISAGFMKLVGPGFLAAYYEKVGGVVRYLGKPYPEVYNRAAALLDGVPVGRIIAIGDSLEHDIAGGRRFGCLTAFVEAGIHAADLAKPDGLSRLCAHYGATPDFIIPKLLW